MRINSCRKGLTMYGEYVAGAMDASEWQRKHDIDKACAWLADNADNYYEASSQADCCYFDSDQMVEDFRKAMEEDQ